MLDIYSKNIIYNILLIIITIYIFIEFINITSMVYYYKLNIDYGDKLNKSCLNNNTEYETKRYQLYNNILNIKLSNDKYNKNNNKIVLIISLIVLLVITLIFAYIVYNVIMDIKGNNSDDNNLSGIFYKLLMVVSVLFTLIYIPLLIGLKVGFINKITSNTDDKIFINIRNIYLVMSLLIILLHYNVNNNKKFSTQYYILYLLFYIGAVYYTDLVIKLYNDNNIIIDYGKSENEYDNNNDENILNSYLKEVFGIKYYKQENILDSDLLNINYYVYIIQLIIIILIILLILNRIIKGINKYYSGNLSLIELISCLLYKKDCDEISMIFNSKETKLIYELIFKPILILVIIYILILATYKYNEKINKYIIYKPLNLYKKELSILNDKFENLITNDKISFEYNKSVPKNIANGILLVIYNDIFGDILDMGNQESNDDYNKYVKYIDITPEFKYTIKNINDENNYNYNDLKEYDIKYYLKNKDKYKNIFDNINTNEQCSDINKYLIYYIIKSVILNDKYKDDKNHLYNLEYLKGTETNDSKYKKILKIKIYDSILNINNGRTYNGKRKIDYKDSDNINNKLNPILKIKYNREQDIDKYITEIEKNNLIIKYKFIINNIIDIYIAEYIIIVQDIILKYKDELNITQDSDIEGKDKITDELLIKVLKEDICKDDTSRLLCIKKDEINNATKKVKEDYNYYINNMFIKINNLLSDNNGNKKKNSPDKLSKYILNNYNNINNDKQKIINQVISAEDKDENSYQIHDEFYNIMKGLYYNHYYIINLSNKYNELYSDLIINKAIDISDKLGSYIDDEYDGIDNIYNMNPKDEKIKNRLDIKMTYYNEIIKLQNILNNTIYKVVSVEINSELRSYIINNIIKLKGNQDNGQDIDIDNIDNIKSKISQYNIIISNGNGVATEEEGTATTETEAGTTLVQQLSDNKEMTLIIDLLTLQLELLKMLENTKIKDINYNNILNNIKYEEIFRNKIEEYKDTYEYKDTDEDKEKDDFKKIIDRIETSKLINKEVNEASNIIIFLIIIYIILYIMLLMIKN